MALGECDQFHGNKHFFEGDPKCRMYENVLYLPVIPGEQSTERSFGLYDEAGQLIEAAGKFIGPGRAVGGPRLRTSVARSEVSQSSDIPMFYMGWFTNHFGHFLVDTLCRMWAWNRVKSLNIKILYHGQLAPDKFFETSFAAEIFSALTLTEYDFIKFDKPTIIRVIIANPAFEELNFCFRAFAKFFNEIGERFFDRNLAKNDTPIYLTKMNLKTGVSRFVNEFDFVERLSKASVDIISPEALPFREQIRLFQSRTTVTGVIGSALHTSIFFPRRKLLVLNYERILWTNQILIDKANRNRSVFVYDLSSTVNEGMTPSFGNNYRIEDPKRLAEDFLRRIEFFKIENELSSDA